MAETSAVKTGIKAAVYRNAGTYGSPTWTLIGLVRGVTPNAKWNRSDASARQTKAVLQAKTQIAISGSIEVRADDADAGYQALFDAAMADSDSALDLLILDGLISVEGAKGVRAHMNLDFGQNQDIGGVIYTTFDYDPAWHSAGYPSKVEMGASSAPTLTAF